MLENYIFANSVTTNITSVRRADIITIQESAFEKLQFLLNDSLKYEYDSIEIFYILNSTLSSIRVTKSMKNFATMPKELFDSIINFLINNRLQIPSNNLTSWLDCWYYLFSYNSAQFIYSFVSNCDCFKVLDFNNLETRIVELNTSANQSIITTFNAFINFNQEAV